MTTRPGVLSVSCLAAPAAASAGTAVLPCTEARGIRAAFAASTTAAATTAAAVTAVTAVGVAEDDGVWGDEEAIIDFLVAAVCMDEPSSHTQDLSPGASGTIRVEKAQAQAAALLALRALHTITTLEACLAGTTVMRWGIESVFAVLAIGAGDVVVLTGRSAHLAQ